MAQFTSKGLASQLLAEDSLDPQLEKRFSLTDLTTWAQKFAGESHTDLSANKLLFQYSFPLEASHKRHFEALFKKFFAQAQTDNFLPKSAEYVVQLFTPATWQKKFHRLPDFPCFPASYFYAARTPKVFQLIWSDPHPKNRLDVYLISLQLFMGELIGSPQAEKLRKRFPKEVQQPVAEWSVQQKARICRFFNWSLGSLEQAYQVLGEKQATQAASKILIGKKLFFESAVGEQPSDFVQQTVEQAFTEFQQIWHQQPEKNLTQTLQKTFALARPHRIFSLLERNAIDHSFNQAPIDFLHITTEKLVALAPVMETLLQSLQHLTTNTPLPQQGLLNNAPISADNPLVQKEQALVDLQLTAQQILRSKKAVAFLAPTFLLSDEQKQERKKFPLELHLTYFPLLANQLHNLQIQPKVLNHFLHNYFEYQPWQKLYNLCQLTLALHRHGSYAKRNIDELKLQAEKRKLEAWLKYYCPFFQDWLAALRFVCSLTLFKHPDKQDHERQQRIKHYIQAWKLFVGNVYVLSYLQKSFLTDSIKRDALEKKMHFQIKHQAPLQRFFYLFFTFLYQEQQRQWQPLLHLLDPGYPLVDSWLETGVLQEQKKLDYLKKKAAQISAELTAIWA